MTLSWTSFSLPLTTTFSDALAHFFVSILPTLTHWQNVGGGATADVLFDSGVGGGLLEPVALGSTERYAWWRYDAALTDKLGNNSENWAARSATIFQSVNTVHGICHLDGKNMANKTDFFGGGANMLIRLNAVTSGPFERGETVTFDSGGLDLTGTVVDHLTGFATDHLVISGLSGTWTVSTLFNKTVSGGTSGASSSVAASDSISAWVDYAAVNEFHLRAGTTFPAPSDVLTGQSSGHTGTVLTVDEAQGIVNMDPSLQTGRFEIDEIVEWNSGTETASVGWAPYGCRGFVSYSPGVGDFVLDTDVCLVGEDEAKLILLIPDTAGNRYQMFAAGEWIESLEGGGLLKTVLVGTSDEIAAPSFAWTPIGWVDLNGQWHGVNMNSIGSHRMGPYLNSALLTAHTTEVKRYWSEETFTIPYATRIIYRDGYWVGRHAFQTRELFFLPQQALKTLESLGSWTNNEPVALHINDAGFCVEFNDPTITP